MCGTDRRMRREPRVDGILPESPSRGRIGHDRQLVARRFHVGEVGVLSRLGSPAGEGNPTLTRDGRVVVFNSSRDDPSDLWYATRASEDVQRPVVDGATGDIYRAEFEPL